LSSEQLTLPDASVVKAPPLAFPVQLNPVKTMFPLAPLVKLMVVEVVVLPMVIAFALADAPMFMAPVVPESTVKVVLAAEESVTAPAPVYELAAAILTPASEVMESALSASWTSTLPAALMTKVAPSAVIESPLTANVPAVTMLSSVLS
jgi:hypothetical protein